MDPAKKTPRLDVPAPSPEGPRDQGPRAPLNPRMNQSLQICAMETSEARDLVLPRSSRLSSEELPCRYLLTLESWPLNTSYYLLVRTPEANVLSSVVLMG
ncbi:hypothetical protein N7468_005424 [Penicillium chermesinum]|uniref:Uncharacterized protein n=1 Tax=Penicillium chermesinum TaxID=63820 RepID=A0A9W9P1U7_9EURO|nr:uncharacterized protein N7468_005424 [Penicillium chermesinum]KAJ5232468.1 hypothetical protein N7468_005424 [Penicillium chermesinum]